MEIWLHYATYVAQHVAYLYLIVYVVGAFLLAVGLTVFVADRLARRRKRKQAQNRKLEEERRKRDEKLQLLLEFHEEFDDYFCELLGRKPAAGNKPNDQDGDR